MSASVDTRSIEYLRRLGTVPDRAIELAEAALVLASLDRPDVPLPRYREHLALLDRTIAAKSERLGTGKGGLEDRIELLNGVFFGEYGYRGDSVSYDDLENANLMSVIDRRRGIPVSLGILYIHLARARGWTIAGLSFPGHFMVRLEHDGRRAIIDPFNEGAVREVAELREMLRTSHGDAAELTPAHYAPVANRDILIRLQNNLKMRLAQAEEHAQALAIVERMMLFAPADPHLWHDSAALHAKLGNLRAAIAALEGFMARTEEEEARRQAAVLLRELRSRLN